MRELIMEEYLLFGGFPLLKQPENPVLRTGMNAGLELEFESCRVSVRP